jgi:hypothetical protein
MLHVDFERKVSSLGIILKLLSIDESISNLGFSNEMHEFIFSIGKRSHVIVAHIL